jgi:hypothetical protein
MSANAFAGLLEGFVGGMEEHRERERQEAEKQWERSKGMLEDVLSGRWGQPTPETVQEAMENMAELSQGPQKKKTGKGLSRLKGEYKQALPSLLQRMLAGDPYTDEQRPRGLQFGEMQGGPAGTGQAAPGPGDAGGPSMAAQLQLPGAEGQTTSQGRQTPDVAGTGERAGMTPPPGEADPTAERMQIAQGLNNATSRFGQGAGPAAIPQEGKLNKAAMDGAATLSENPPLQSRPLQQVPTGPRGMFMSPEQSQKQQLDMQRAGAIAQAGDIDAAYNYLQQTGKYDDSQIRSMLKLTQDPSMSQTTSHPFASTVPRKFSSPDGSQTETFFVYKDGSVRTVQGQPLPEGWIEPDALRGSRPRIDVFTHPGSGVSTVVDLDAVLAEGGQVDPSFGLPAGLPVGAEGRAPDRVPAEEAVRARSIKDAVDTSVGQQVSSQFMMTPEQQQEVRDTEAQRYGYDSYQALVEAGAAATTEAYAPPEGGLTPPPAGVATPGINEDPAGTPRGMGQEVGPQSIPGLQDLIDYSNRSEADDPQELVSRWLTINNTGGGDWLGGVDFMQELGMSPAEVMETAQADQSVMDYILSEVMKAINSSPTGR